MVGAIKACSKWLRFLALSMENYLGLMTVGANGPYLELYGSAFSLYRAV